MAPSARGTRDAVYNDWNCDLGRGLSAFEDFMFKKRKVYASPRLFALAALLALQGCASFSPDGGFDFVTKVGPRAMN